MKKKCNKCNIVFCFVCFISLLLKVNYVFAADEGDKNKYAFEIERYFTILNRDSILTITDIYEKQNYNVLDFLRNKNKQHIFINSYFIVSNFKSIDVSEYEEKGKFKYESNHDYNLENFTGDYSYIFDFGKNSEFLLMPYLSFGLEPFNMNYFMEGDDSIDLKFNIFTINGSLYTRFKFLNYENSSLFIDVLLSLNFNNTFNNTNNRKKSAYNFVKTQVSNFDVNFMLGLGYKAEFEVSKLLGKVSFLPKISFLKVGKKMDSKNIIDKENLKDLGGDVTANYNSVYAMPSFDLTINDMFKSIFLGEMINTLSFKFKYLVDIASDYKNSYKFKSGDTQMYVLYPRPPEGFDISLGLGLDKKYFAYKGSYNFNRKAIIFDFNLKF